MGDDDGVCMALAVSDGGIAPDYLAITAEQKEKKDPVVLNSCSMEELHETITQVKAKVRMSNVPPLKRIR